MHVRLSLRSGNCELCRPALPEPDSAPPQMEMNARDKAVSEWRTDLVATHGEAIVVEMEKTDVPWDCRDTMDGRHWCRVHDASWPSFTGTGCTAWVRLREQAPQSWHDAARAGRLRPSIVGGVPLDPVHPVHPPTRGPRA